MNERPTQDSSDQLRLGIVEIVLLLIVLAVLTIAALTLLGPAISEPSSQIYMSI